MLLSFWFVFSSVFAANMLAIGRAFKRAFLLELGGLVQLVEISIRLFFSFPLQQPGMSAPCPVRYLQTADLTLVNYIEH